MFRRMAQRKTLLVVDDADHLSAHNLCWLTNAAGSTNTKLILITTTGNHHEPAHTLLDSVLAGWRGSAARQAAASADRSWLNGPAVPSAAGVKLRASKGCSGWFTQT